MKDFATIFSRRYSAVSTKEENVFLDQLQEHSQKSFRNPKTLPRGFSIVDSFFNKRKSGERTRSPKCVFLLMAGGLLAITVAILVRIFQPYELIFRWKLIFGPDGEIFNLWEKPPVDLYVKIYLFNITNSEDFLAGRDKMRVEEVGPYVYKEVLSHDDIVFNDNGTVSSKPRHPLIWQEELSEGHREDDEVVMLNIALLSIAQVAAEKSYFFRLPINLLIRQTRSQPIVKMTAKEFMFGYETSLTTIGNTFLPDWISFDKVGLIDRMYDFDSDFETFYTGETDSSISGLYDTYRGSKLLPQWKGEHCSNIEKASDGTKFKSFLEPNDTVLFFRKSMCRPQRMIASGEEDIIGTLKAHKYVFEENALDNGHFDERNKCYCRDDYCHPYGLSDVTECYYGFPIALSYPHFMDADPKLLDDIVGCQPNRSLHESYFMIQPRSGLPLNCSVKFQINMHMRDVSSMAHVERFSHITIPMVWFEITLLGLPEPLKNRFNLYLNILPYVDILGFWAVLFGGGLCLLLAVSRVTMGLPTFFTSSQKQLSNKNTANPDQAKYAEGNLRSGVYKACEMKLMDAIGKSDTENSDSALCKINMDDDNYNILEREPPISDDEGNDSENGQNPSNYSSESEKSESSQKANDKMSFTSSGFDSKDGHPSGSWKLGEASSFIEDIGNEQFTLNISESMEDVLENYKSNAT